MPPYNKPASSASPHACENPSVRASANYLIVHLPTNLLCLCCIHRINLVTTVFTLFTFFFLPQKSIFKCRQRSIICEYMVPEMPPLLHHSSAFFSFQIPPVLSLPSVPATCTSQLCQPAMFFCQPANASKLTTCMIFCKPADCVSAGHLMCLCQTAVCAFASHFCLCLRVPPVLKLATYATTCQTASLQSTTKTKQKF
jgi:hypothetical protein